MDEKIRQPHSLRVEEDTGGSRGCGLKANCEEYDLPLRIPFRELQCIHRRIYDAHVRSLCLGRQQRPAFPTRDAKNITVSAQGDSGLESEAYGQINSRSRQNADRASWTMHELYVLWQKFVQAEAEDSVRMATAEFHQPISAIVANT